MKCVKMFANRFRIGKTHISQSLQLLQPKVNLQSHYKYFLHKNYRVSLLITCNPVNCIVVILEEISLFPIKILGFPCKCKVHVCLQNNFNHEIYLSDLPILSIVKNFYRWNLLVLFTVENIKHMYFLSSMLFFLTIKSTYVLTIDEYDW